LEEDWKRIGRGLEEDWKEDWKRIGRGKENIELKFKIATTV
jgi:hypothetical protein